MNISVTLELSQQFCLSFLFGGNYGKAVRTGRPKKSQSKEELRRSREDLSEETQGLLESEEELDREDVLNPEPENRSVSAAMRPQPTDYDRCVTATLNCSWRLSTRVTGAQRPLSVALSFSQVVPVC